MDQFVIRTPRPKVPKPVASTAPKTLKQMTIQSMRGVIVIDEFMNAKKILESAFSTPSQKLDALHTLSKKNPSSDILDSTKLLPVLEQLRAVPDKDIAREASKIYTQWTERRKSLLNRPIIEVKYDAITQKYRDKAKNLLKEALLSTSKSTVSSTSSTLKADDEALILGATQDVDDVISVVSTTSRGYSKGLRFDLDGFDKVVKSIHSKKSEVTSGGGKTGTNVKTSEKRHGRLSLSSEDKESKSKKTRISDSSRKENLSNSLKKKEKSSKSLKRESSKESSTNIKASSPCLTDPSTGLCTCLTELVLTSIVNNDSSNKDKLAKPCRVSSSIAGNCLSIEKKLNNKSHGVSGEECVKQETGTDGDGRQSVASKSDDDDNGNKALKLLNNSNSKVNHDMSNDLMANKRENYTMPSAEHKMDCKTKMNSPKSSKNKKKNDIDKHDKSRKKSTSVKDQQMKNTLESGEKTCDVEGNTNSSVMCSVIKEAVSHRINKDGRSSDKLKINKDGKSSDKLKSFNKQEMTKSREKSESSTSKTDKDNKHSKSSHSSKKHLKRSELAGDSGYSSNYSDSVGSKSSASDTGNNCSATRQETNKTEESNKENSTQKQTDETPCLGKKRKLDECGEDKSSSNNEAKKVKQERNGGSEQKNISKYSTEDPKNNKYKKSKHKSLTEIGLIDTSSNKKENKSTKKLNENNSCPIKEINENKSTSNVARGLESSVEVLINVLEQKLFYANNRRMDSKYKRATRKMVLALTHQHTIREALLKDPDSADKFILQFLEDKQKT